MHYLNKQNKERVMKYAAMVAELEEIIADVEAHGGKCTPLKYAKTYIFKQMDQQMEGLSDDKIKELLDQARRKEVGFYVKG